MANALWDIEEQDSDNSGTVFRDVLMLALTGFVAPVSPEYGLKQILNTQVKLVRQYQEETAFGFRLNKQGKLIPGSVSKIRRRLITSPAARPSGKRP